ncbi:MAG: hypothetical protein JWN44_2132 [Myxococcales bacterium]|nr:hypothetical protein [Myxococcales bacterium]
MRREDGFERREDEPTRPVRVPRLRMTQETGEILKIAVDPNEPTTTNVSGRRTAR